MKNAVEDAMWLKWQDAAPKIYDRIYYESNPVVAYITNAGHRHIEKPFGPDVEFKNVLEVGAGTGKHFSFVKHRFERYVLSDLSQKYLDTAKSHIKNPNVEFQVADATALPFEDASFDRLISMYNLEHLPFPHDVLKEWRRVVRPGGVISISIPTEGGLAWNMGRHLTTRRYFAKLGLDLDYIISREHVNTCYRLMALIRHYFGDQSETWFPLQFVPSPHVNLIVSVNITV